LGCSSASRSRRSPACSSRCFSLRHAEALDGLAVLGLLLFATAIMDGVTAMALEQPGFTLLCALAVFG
jgi:hypothetical protein